MSKGRVMESGWLLPDGPTAIIELSVHPSGSSWHWARIPLFNKVWLHLLI